MVTFDSYSAMFQRATNEWPYQYQQRMAQMAILPPVVRVETGLGKTAAVALAWVWNRRFADENVRTQTPRRLVYCLPQRSLVTQTAEAIRQWISNLELSDLESGIRVRVLMGGDLDGDWDLYPEEDQILVGTQDQLLSRALNRGYAMSRYRWPMHYAWLNNDVQWIVDECQLMEAGLATTTQLQSFREEFGTRGPAHTTWMSATLNPTWLQTVDYADAVADFEIFSLDAKERAEADIAKKLNARKQVIWANWKMNAQLDKDLDAYAENMVADIMRNHVLGTLSLVIVNRVARAQAIFKRLRVMSETSAFEELVLVHSRFRAHEREEIQKRLDRIKDGKRNAIIVATQAVEAGVDLSARTLITELAPWSSLVQRFGRCNRKGEAPDTGPDLAKIIVVDMENVDDAEVVAIPYSAQSMTAARTIVRQLTDAAPAYLPDVDQAYEWGAVLRRRELLDWFDTTSDLSGYDVDVSPYVRGSLDTDVLVLWRGIDRQEPPDIRINDAELCRVSISQFRDFLKKKLGKETRDCWYWNPLEGKWEDFNTASRPRPGEMYCMNITLGGYDSELGFYPNSDRLVEAILIAEGERLETNQSDFASLQTDFISLADHTNSVREEMHELMQFFDDAEMKRVLEISASWHDVGKAHEVFQDKLLRGHGDNPALRATIWAKSPTVATDTVIRSKNTQSATDQSLSKRRSRFFRHELASAISFLENRLREQTLAEGEVQEVNLIAYIVAAHHGKVRVSIRSLPKEPHPPEVLWYARGVWDGDVLPQLILDHGMSMKPTVLHMDWMAMGYDNGRGQASWLERVLGLLERHGPFRLAWMESMLRVADWRGSKKGGSPL